MQRELLLVKVRADETTRREVLEIVELFQAKVADVGPEALTIEVTGRRQARGDAADARAVRHPRDGAVRHGRARPRPTLDDEAARPAPVAAPVAA